MRTLKTNSLWISTLPPLQHTRTLKMLYYLQNSWTVCPVSTDSPASLTGLFSYTEVLVSQSGKLNAATTNLPENCRHLNDLKSPTVQLTDCREAGGCGRLDTWQLVIRMVLHVSDPLLHHYIRCYRCYRPSSSLSPQEEAASVFTLTGPRHTLLSNITSVSVCLTAWLSVCLSACLPACLPACLSVCLSVCLPACLPVCLSVCLSVCLPSWSKSIFV